MRRFRLSVSGLTTTEQRDKTGEEGDSSSPVLMWSEVNAHLLECDEVQVSLLVFACGVLNKPAQPTRLSMDFDTTKSGQLSSKYSEAITAGPPMRMPRAFTSSALEAPASTKIWLRGGIIRRCSRVCRWPGLVPMTPGIRFLEMRNLRSRVMLYTPYRR